MKQRKPMVELQQVSFSYTLGGKQKIPVFQDISLTIYEGEYVAVIGHNGSGKSTLAKHLNGILIPESGVVLVDGMDTKDKEKKLDIRRRVGMVFQSPDNQLVATIVEDDVAFGLENLGVPQAQMKARVDEALQAVGMEAFRNRPPHFLSGGQKQRVAIAGILAMRPECLVLDEATSMLDTFGRKEILGVVRSLHQQGMTIVTITHHMSEVAEVDRVIVMEAGKVVLEGTPREIFAQHEVLEQLQLDIPESNQIARAVHEVVPQFRADLISRTEVIDEVERLMQVERRMGARA
ncbi:energy-coupling factor transporter ATPase [Alicyclobacillus curvatus]|nr:energy-coupling factor transporter ATPase [Alicyclobacillus curvatus]